MTLVLASASQSRARLLTAAGVPFTVMPAALDEAGLMADLGPAGPDPVALALAEQKALAVSRRAPAALVLGGDSVIGFAGENLSKCADLGEARTLLLRLAGHTHRLVSAAALARSGAVIWRHTAPSEMTMRAFSPAFVEDYLAAEGEGILDSVGCYHFEGRGAQLFDAVKGDYFAVLGLPLLAVLAALRKEGALAA
jgi:septum formation protein